MGDKMKRFLDKLDDNKASRDYKKYVKANYNPNDTFCFYCGSTNTEWKTEDISKIAGKLTGGIAGKWVPVLHCRDCDIYDPNKKKR